MEAACTYCRTSRAELRPYGPNGAWVCFGCMKSNPQHEAEAKRQFAGQLDAAGPCAVIGSSVGPYPARSHPGLFSPSTATPAKDSHD